MKLIIPDDKIHVHNMVLPMRWGDMDAIGHVNNTTYFRYMECARTDWLSGIKAQLQAEDGGVVMGADGTPNKPKKGPIIVNAFCNFNRELVFPGDLLLKFYVANPKRSTLDTFVEMERTDNPGVVHATGGATVVWIDFEKKKSVALPKLLSSREAIEEYVASKNEVLG